MAKRLFLKSNGGYYFRHFRDFDYKKLLAASIPVLQSKLGIWVGVTKNRSLAVIYDYLGHFPESAIYPNSEEHQEAV